jgi:hypothetical protein
MMVTNTATTQQKGLEEINILHTLVHSLYLVAYNTLSTPTLWVILHIGVVVILDTEQEIKILTTNIRTFENLMINARDQDILFKKI